MTELASTLRSLPGHLPQRRSVLLIALVLSLIAITVISAGSGAVGITPGEVFAIIGSRIGLELPWSFELRQEHVLLAIRLPRILLGLLIGAALAVSGSLMQGLFRNPLADPSLIGTSSGASLAAVSVIVLGSSLLKSFSAAFGSIALPLAAFAGGLLATLLIYRIANARGPAPVTSMLLAGIAINALAGAVVGGLLFIADDAQLRSVTFWSMGSLGGASWEQLAVVGPMIAIILVAAPRLARHLNVLLLGEAEAGHLGISVAKLKRSAIVLCAVGVGASVAVAGSIGFIGLVAPHVIRLALGPDHRGLIPGSALLGASLLVGSDLIARTAVSPAEMPIGIITSLFGAPLFLWLLMRNHRASREARC